MQNTIKNTRNTHYNKYKYIQGIHKYKIAIKTTTQ